MERYGIVAHHYWGRPGGGQLVCAAAAYSLEKLGYRPVLASPVRIDVGRYPEWFGIDLSRYPVVEGRVRLRAFGLYLRLLVWRAVKKAVSRYGARLVFTDESTYGPIVGWLKKRGVRLVEYIHFPIEVMLREEFRGTGLYYGEDPYILERYSRFPMNVYFRVYLWLLPRFLRGNPFEAADAVLVNSRWTARVARMVYGEEPIVLNPPLPPTIPVAGRPRGFEERGLAVVMVGRFSEEKRYHWVVSQLAPRLVREVPGVRLYIFGSTGTPSARAYYRRVWRLAEEAGLRVSGRLDRDADVYLVENAPRRVIDEALESARAFLHATINEHWGIVVAEAMAHGTPVVVHKSGGAWSDLAEEGRRGLGYETVEEAVEALARLLTDEKTFRFYSERGVERVRDLTLDRFAERLGEVLKKIGAL